MRTLLNIIWLIFSGIPLGVGYILAGIINCITIIGIPFGIASFRLANYAFWPFGRRIVDKPTAGIGSAIGNVIWVIVSGIWLALGHVFSGIILCITIVGIPLALGNFRMVPISLTPLGKEIVPE